MFFVFCFLFFVFCSVSVFSGELILSDGYVNPACTSTIERDSPCGVSRLIKCNNEIVLFRTVGMVCNGPVAGRNERNNVAYEFNDSTNGGDREFGTISRKSSSNVFSARPLSSNYRPYSSDGILDKPVILVEGYDPDNNTNPDFYYNRGFNQLVYGGRDLFIVNFPNGSGSINDNAVLLQNIIQEINGAKTGNFPTAVIGYSMGGLVARKALKNMELAGIDHQTSLYVSYDAPHLGANAPLALEETVNDLIHELSSKTAGKTDAALKRAKNVYNSSAAREMLIAGPDFKNITPGDFPSNLVRVAVTSGSLSGVNGLQSNSVYEGEYVAGFRFYLYKNWWGQWSNSYQWYSKQRGSAYYDNTPGSYDQTFYRAYLQLKDGADSFEEWNVAKNQNVTFVPTISSLAISVAPTTYLKDLFSYKSPFDRYIAVDESGADACTVFNAQTAIGKNIQHNPGGYYFDGNQLAQLKCALDTYHKIGFSIPDRSFKTY